MDGTPAEGEEKGSKAKKKQKIRKGFGDRRGYGGEG